MLQWISPYNTKLMDQKSSWGRQRLDFWLRTIAVLLVVIAVCLVIYSVLVSEFYSYYFSFDTTGFIWLSIFSLIGMMYVDYAGIRAGMQVVGEALVNSDDANLQENTPIYHSMARLRIWRLTLAFVGWRLVTVFLSATWLVSNINNRARFDVFDVRMTINFILVMLGLILAIAAVVYVLEPIWRTRLTTAAGITLALRKNQAETESLFSHRAFWVVALYWFGVYVVCMLTTFGFNAINHPLSPLAMGEFVMIAIWFSVVIGGLIAYYHRSTTSTLNQAEIGWLDQGAVNERLASFTAESAEVRKPRYTLFQRFFGWVALVGVMHSRNPVYIMEARTLKRGRTTTELRWWTIRVVRRVLIISLILGAILFFITYRSTSTYYSSGGYRPSQDLNYVLYRSLLETLVIGGMILGGTSILVNVLLDFSCIIAGLSAINRDMIDGRWDLMRMTMLRESQVVIAKHAMTKLRSWRMMSWIFGMRLVSILAGILVLFVPSPYGASTYVTPIQQLIEFAVENPVGFGMVAVTTVWFFTIYLLETFWRHHALTAVGLAVSTGRSTTSSLLAGLGAIAGIWISQIIIAIALFWSLARIMNSLSYYLFYVNGNYNYNPNYEYISMGMVMVTAFITGWVIFGYYSILQRINLNSVLRRAFRG